MPIPKLIDIKDLKLDLGNFRTVPQRSEVKAVHALIAINPSRFWALMASLLDDGYHSSENIIVLKTRDGKHEVREGNRRIGALKIIHGVIDANKFDIPADITDKIDSIGTRWFSENRKVPCAVYGSDEVEMVDRQVSLIHGKGEKAGRDPWNAVARARHNREKGGKKKEHGLDLLEKYLKHGKNVSDLQKERWGGEYPLSVLDEAVQKVYPRFQQSSSRSLVDVYPNKINRRTKLEEMISDIGLENIGFSDIRDSINDVFSIRYNLEVEKGKNDNNSKKKEETNNKSDQSISSSTVSESGKTGQRREGRSYATTDSRSVIGALKSLKPRGKQREKLLTLIDEAKRMKLDKHSHAFCFVLRVMFELSAKAYCEDHKANGGPKYRKQDGNDRTLESVLRDITKHLTDNNSDNEMTRKLHGAIAELGNQSGLLSVTSMNQLVHNPQFVVDEIHICSVFHNVFPLLVEMNRE